MFGYCRRCTRHRRVSAGLCWQCRKPMRDAARARARAAARRPPKCAAYGRCFVCAGPIPKGRYTSCSKECAALWDIASRPRAHLLRLHGDRCWSCGAGGCEADHVRPLWSLTADERSQIRWWLPANLQLLCRRCHRAKTSREASERAIRRAA